MRIKKILILTIVIATLAVVGFLIVETYKASVDDSMDDTGVTVPSRPSATKVVPLGIGNSITVGNVTVTFLDVTEDSRCPTNAQCIWAGRLVAKIAVSVDGQNKEESIELGKSFLVGDYSVSLVDIKPDTYAGREMLKSDYRGVFKIEKMISALFTCSNGASLTARFIPNEVELKISDRTESLRLPIAISASGARYANSDESLVFWNKGNNAFMTENGTTTYSDCVTR